MASVPKLVGHTKGIDVCASRSSTFIIRSDLGCYMEVTKNLDNQQELKIFPLHPSCAGGDHYMNDGTYFYIIQDNHYVCVDDLSIPTGMPIEPIPLDTYCENGQHYLFANGSFYIINEKSGKTTYKVVQQLSGNENQSSKEKASPEVRPNGIYYFGTPNKTYPKYPIGVINQVDQQWGVLFTVTESLDKKGNAYFLLPDIINFLPGGLAKTFGPAESSWKLLQSFTNTSNSEFNWSKSITKTVGYNKQRFQSIENSWSVSSSMGTKFESSFLGQASLETQFSLTASAGGASIRSEQEDWSEQYTTEEQVQMVIPPKGSVYIWQFTLGLKGSGEVLFCRDLQLTDSPDPPKDPPLQKVTKQYFLR